MLRSVSQKRRRDDGDGDGAEVRITTPNNRAQRIVGVPAWLGEWEKRRCEMPPHRLWRFPGFRRALTDEATNPLTFCKNRSRVALCACIALGSFCFALLARFWSPEVWDEVLGFLAYSSSPRWFPELVSRERGFFALVVAVWFSAPGDGACVVEFEVQS